MPKQKLRTVNTLQDLIPDDRNANAGTKEGAAMIERSLREYGAGRSILIDKNGRIIAGNKTVENAVNAGVEDILVVQTDGKKLVAVQRIDLDLTKDRAARELAIADNRAAEINLEWDHSVLAAMRGEVDLGEFFSERELRDIFDDEMDVPDPQLDRAAELQEKWKTARGQIWKIDEHRLMCGDCTTDDVDTLMQGDIPFLCVTDPPYGVSYDPKWRNVEAAKGNLAYAARRTQEVLNDDRADWREAWERFPGDVIYSWHPAGATSLVHAAALQDSGFVLRMQIIWAKSNFPIGRGDYHVRHEPCWYAVREGKPSKRTDDRTQTTLWEINLDRNVEGGHSTQKPAECMARPMRNHEPCDVYDPFLGSGTTLCAAQVLGRKCYAIEIDPKSVAISLERISDMGLKPKLCRS